MTPKTAFLALASLLTLSLLAAGAAERTVYSDITAHYETMRLSLLADSLAELTEHADAIVDRATALAADFDPAVAGVAAGDSDACRALLPEIVQAAERLAAATDLEQARELFYELSKPLGRYRKLAGDISSKVAYCPMARKAWIQPADEIGNPYMGAEMPDCGRIIAD